MKTVNEEASRSTLSAVRKFLLLHKEGGMSRLAVFWKGDLAGQGCCNFYINGPGVEKKELGVSFAACSTA